MTTERSWQHLNKPLPETFPARHYSRNTLNRLLAAKEIARIRPGIYAYTTPETVKPHSTFEQRRIHQLLLISAAQWQLKPHEVVSHGSAAALWGLLVPEPEEEVHITVAEGAQIRRQGERRHLLYLPESHVTTRHAIRVTTLERTIVDCMRTAKPMEALAIADHALARGVSREQCLSINAALRSPKRRKRTTCLLNRATSLAESIPESYMRYVAWLAGMTDLVPQYQVRLEGRTFRLDIGAPQLKIALEYDGRIKYADSPDALYHEKLREDILRRAGWLVVRVVAKDLHNIHGLVARMRAAMRARGIVEYADIDPVLRE
ncbi:hypothetical protein [Timonella sp. A28]|uniref:hypothetical protein n=1 Tax=Timonella sp. A28 TaxID=3442640 RepID=UPI003EBE800F